MDWKTTIPGIVAALVVVIRTIIGVDIPKEVADAIVTLCVFMIGVFGTSKGVKR
jgi:hypothetical protein